jgi:hypothetical protein
MFDRHRAGARLLDPETSGPMQEGITRSHWAVVFNPMSHVGTHAQQSNLCVAF